MKKPFRLFRRHSLSILFLIATATLFQSQTSFAFHYRILPNPHVRAETRLESGLYGTVWLALGALTSNFCNGDTDLSGYCYASPVGTSYVSAGSAAIATTTAVGGAYLASAIAPEFYSTLTTQLSSGFTLSWENSRKLRFIQNPHEFTQWINQHERIFGIATDEFRSGELPAIYDLVRFTQGHWDREILARYLADQGIDAGAWAAAQEQALAILEHGATIPVRNQMYRFLEAVRTAAELRQADLDTAAKRAGWGLLFRGVGAVVGHIFEAPEAGDFFNDLGHAATHDGARIARRARAEAHEVPVAMGIHALVDANVAADPGIRAVLPPVVLPLIAQVRAMFEAEGDADGGEAQEHNAGDGIAALQDVAPALNAVEENMLVNLPFLRELYTNGPGNDIMSTREFRQFLVMHVDLMQIATAQFFQNEENLAALRALPTVEVRQAHILERLGAE